MCHRRQIAMPPKAVYHPVKPHLTRDPDAVRVMPKPVHLLQHRSVHRRVRPDQYSLQLPGINLNLNDVAIKYLPDGTPCECLRSDVSDTGSCRYTREPRVRNQGDVFAKRKMFQCGCQLVDFLHACAFRSSATQHDDVTRLDIPLHPDL